MSKATIGAIPLALLVFTVLIASACDQGSSATRATVTARFPIRATPTIRPATPPPTPAVTGIKVSNTDGTGAYIRRKPIASEKIKAWADGTTMVVIGPDQEVDGMLWKNVRDPDGNEGWVPAEYLAGTSVSALPTQVPQPNITDQRNVAAVATAARGGP